MKRLKYPVAGFELFLCVCTLLGGNYLEGRREVNVSCAWCLAGVQKEIELY